MPAMASGATLGFLHGYALRFGELKPRRDLGVVLVAPKGPGAALRQRFLEGRGIPCLFAVHQECHQTGVEAGPDGDLEGAAAGEASGEAELIGLAWASAIGCGRAGIVRTTVADEAETDLFGEQAVLCGGTIALAKAAFETLVDAGYPPELAYVECVHELKQVVDLVFERGLEGMYAQVSETAEFGGRRAGPRLVDDSLRRRLAELLEEIRSGQFALEMEVDSARGLQEGGSQTRGVLARDLRGHGSQWLDARRLEGRSNAIEAAGRQVRQWIPWLADSSGAGVAAEAASTTQAPADDEAAP